MDVSQITVDQFEAGRLMRKYQEHRAYQKPNEMDLEIERIYRQIARGKVVIRALESIRKAGLGNDNLPKLAIARADATKCFLRIGRNGNATMADARWHQGGAARSRYFDFETGTFGFRADQRYGEHSAFVPHIPPDIRPARGLENYHILWDAVWTKEPPIDPILLRRMGKRDIWLVCGAWDLTPVERAVMADRIR